MKNFLLMVVAAAAGLTAAAWCAKEAEALGTYPPKDSQAQFVAPAPMAPKLPADGGSINATVPSGTSACLYAGKGVCVRLDCKSAQCDYRETAIEADAGWPAFPDAGLALPGDVTLPADTVEAYCLPASLDSVCAYFEGAGTLQVVPRYP